MDTFWNWKRFAMGEWRRTAIVCVLRASTIAAVASSCTAMEGNSQLDVESPAPYAPTAEESRFSPQVRLLPTDLENNIKIHVESLGFDPSKIQDIYVTVSLEEGEGAKLLPFATANGLPNPDPEVKLEGDNLRIPINRTQYLTEPNWQAIIIYTRPGSKVPADPPCGNSGGSGYCDF